MAALSRMATGSHKKIHIGPNDTVIFSSHPIPGNEKDVYNIVNTLMAKGANVIYSDIAATHVSGHACEEDLKLMLTLVKPKFFMPVHGEIRHLICHSNIAQSLGISSKNIISASNGNIIEITSFRCESGYSDNRRPDSVTFTRSIEEDVKRRDFTINAMYIDSENNIVDITNGREDLKAGIIRAVGNPYNRFNEDALRIMRALRFSARFGFKIEDETANAIHALKDNLNNISVERIHAEFSELLMTRLTEAVSGSKRTSLWVVAIQSIPSLSSVTELAMFEGRPSWRE